MQNRTMKPFTQGTDGSFGILNGNFKYSGSWISDAPGNIGALGNTVYPRQSTPQTGASVNFILQNSSAFFMYGLVDVNLGIYSVEVSVPIGLEDGSLSGENGNSITSIYNATSHWISLDHLIYWASGLDRSATYSVTMTNLGQGDTPWCAFSHVDIIDGSPTSFGRQLLLP